ncbi:MAG: HIT family protein [Candidatus Pacebacteria bacterium]|jgi:histidine triad (HIT) family protein|nr:HIT family protein [Candidatus Paceibacterota bacterium]MDD2796652.1 HIT family protein [Candidatus Paceibacterota bacterium]MDD3048256.1 HIT family protein [Candidatus Paceibacterota bacterium]MDD3509989.1 HIT family protein [Candidatus Paceibacterota bacterium]MDD3918589.1 HIT family protein [Candidatus Paceibacterota bacterium]
MDCVFCKIVNNELPSYKVYEDDLVLAFLDLNPVSLGHTLIIPKKHYQNIFDIENKVLKRIAKVSKIIASKLKENLDDVSGVNIFQSNGKIAEQVVMHYHMHIIPRRKQDNFRINDCLKSLKLEHNQFKDILNKIKV